MTWGYLLEFAFRDLTARTALRATVFVVLAVSFAVAFSLIGFGFVRGVELAEYARLQRDPLCLWAGDNTLNGGHISDTDAEKVASLVRSGVQPASKVRGVYPIRLVQFQIVQANGNDTPVTGRTIQLGNNPDPLPETRPVRPGGRWFTGPDDSGIVVTPALVARLGFAETCPKTLKFVVGQVSVEVPILGVMEKDLPVRNHLFVVSEAYAQHLRAPPQDDPESATARAGPIPEEWVTEKEGEAVVLPMIRELLAAAFPEKDFVLEPRLFDLDYHLVVSTRPPKQEDVGATQRKLRKGKWEELFQKVPGATAKAKWRPDPRFGAAVIVEASRGPGAAVGAVAGPPAGYDLLAVYVSDVHALEPAAAVVKRYLLSNDRPLVVDPTVVEQVARIGKQLSQYQGGMTVVAFAMSGMFLAMVWFVFRVRAEQQVAEIGMLKAMGMNRLWALAGLQGSMVGLAGAVVGTAIGWLALGGAMSWFYDPDWELAATATRRELWLAAIAAATAIVGCIVCAWAATCRARWISPAEAIRSAG